MTKYKIFKKQNLFKFEIVKLPDEPTSYYSFVSSKVNDGFNQYTFTVNKFLKLIKKLRASDFTITHIELLEIDAQFEGKLNNLLLTQQIDEIVETIEFLDNYEEVDLKSMSYNYKNNLNNFSFKLQNNGVIITSDGAIDIQRKLFDILLSLVSENEK
ncbi:hypothetical protein N2E94_08695 [Leuconostoc citreum]